MSGLATACPTAPVLPVRALPVPSNGEPPGSKVHISPLETKCLSLAQAESERDGPSGAIAATRGRGEEPAYFLDGERFYLLLGEPWRLREYGWVPDDVVASNGLIEGGSYSPVRLVRCTGSLPSFHHLGVELFEVLGL
ncbi:MAG: hypothetical protein WKF73_18955 [Nocardioidaceae bacterium]